MTRLQWLIADYRLFRLQGMTRRKAAKFAWREFINPQPLPF